MAEAALLGIAKSVLGQLTAPAFQEFLLVCNSKKDFERLEQTVQSIIDFLHDAEQQESNNRLVRGWLSRLRAALYEADDLFDYVSFTAIHKKTMNGNTFNKEVRLFFSKSNQLGFKFKVAHDVKDLRERIEGINKDMLPFGFHMQKIEEKPVSVRLHNREETHSFVKVGEVVGRDRERDEIIKLLLPEDNRGEDQSSLSVISIIGFGGLGKTTLAQLVCNDERVQSGFDKCIFWACLNYLSNLNQVLVAILTSVLKKKPEDNSLDELQKMLRGNIEGKKYLLVLDDVWDEDETIWLDKLKPLLSCGKNGSKVLVTTRKIKVAQCLDSIKPYYHLTVLSEESAWSLFVKMAFEEGELSSCDSRLLLLGKEIVRKCGYLPLALVAIGRMLRYRKKEIRSWESFKDNDLPEVLLGHDVDKVKLMQVLKVSYNDLQPALKHCFAYCSLFPKDYRFDKDQLVRLWIAQGFIIVPPLGEKSLEEVGDDYFFHIADRCFFQEVEMYTSKGCLRCTCKMHDLLHDLAILVAGNESSYFADKGLENMREKTTHRHMSFDCNPNLLLDYSSMSSQSKTLRTLVFFHEMNPQVEAKCLDSFFASFNVLRVLQLPYLKFEKLPDCIGELIHLRYLDLSKHYELIVLPNSICKLHHLQTLILEGCRGLKELPSKLGRLVSLRHLVLQGCSGLKSLPSGLAALTSLVTLDRIVVHHRDGDLRYLGQLDNLCGVIEIKIPGKGWSNCIEDARKSNMSRKHKLNGMIINWGEGEMEKEESKAVLEQLEPNVNLQYLKIQGYRGDTLCNWFSSLSNLKNLVLEDCSLEYLEDISCVRSGGSSLFPCLEILELRSLSNLKGWWRRELGDNAPMTVLLRVSKVVIDDCPYLTESMPLFGREIETLELYKVDGKLVSKLLSTPNMSCSSEFHHYNKLKVISLSGIKDLKCLPKGSIRHLTALKSLRIKGCRELSWVSSCGLAYLTSLESLEIRGRSRVRLEDKDDEKRVEMNNMPWKALQRLRILSVPWQSHLQEGLQYLTCLEELVIEYYEANQVEADNEDMEGRGLLRKLGLLERLQSLRIEFNNIRCSFPKWIQYLRCIKKLRLTECQLMSMSWGILANMNLHTLTLYLVMKVGRSSVEDDGVAEQQTQFNSLLQLDITAYQGDQQWIHDDIPWNLLPSLRTLSLSGILELRSLPDGIQHLTSLQQLSIRDCEGIEGIPNWMINLTSLQRLDIQYCSPKLVERCQRESGVDWHLISHIPDITISLIKSGRVIIWRSCGNGPSI